jgi:hypothetical protein
VCAPAAPTTRIALPLLLSIDAGKLSPYGSAITFGHLSGRYLEREIVKASMSRKVLDRGIVM